MNKRSIRSFAFGVIFSTSIMAVYYYFSIDGIPSIEKSQVLTTEAAKQHLLDENYIVLTEQEHKSETENAVREAIRSLLNDENPQEVAKDKQEEQNTSENDSPKTANYILEVRSGMNATTIAKLLLENGIVKEDDDFHAFLSINGYSKKIRVGKYDLDSTMTLEEIAKKITTP